MLNSKLAQRLFFGTIMGIGLVGVLVFEAWLCARNYFADSAMPAFGFALLLALFIGFAGRELCLLARAKDLRPSLLIAVGFSVALAVMPAWVCFLPIGGEVVLAGMLAAMIMAAGCFQGFKYRNENALGNIALSCFVVLYLGVGGWFIFQIRMINAVADSLWAEVMPLLMFLATVKSADIGAYLIGRKLGRHKWVPSISPAKTWEGLAGGVVLAVIVASIFSNGLGIMPWWAAVVFGLLIAITGQLGDLLESMLKRDLGSKDSARLVPQFGGFLDLLDSVLIAAPFAYVMFRVIHTEHGL